MKLYSYWRSSCSYRVRIALNLKEIAYEIEPVHLVRDGGEQHGPAYRALNPAETVPTLIIGDRKLSESMAIMDYLDALQPERPLFPKDPYQAALVRQFCETINSGIQPMQNLGLLQHLKATFGADQEAVAEWCRHFIARGLGIAETRLEEIAGVFSFGDEPGAGDAFLAPQVYNARRYDVDMSAFPRIQSIMKACEALPAFQKAAPASQPDAPPS